MTLEEKIREKAKTTELEPESPDALYLKLLDTIRLYHPSDDLSLVEKAYALADDAHKDVKRKSGEPYIIHPLHVGIILAELELDKESIAAGLLHDVIEDTEYSYDDIVEMFSKEIAEIVDGVTKLTQLDFSQIELGKEDLQAENLRKMFLAMAKDIRVILIKLADRLHNMRTMEFQKPHKQIEKSRETMEIYAPLAQRLGIAKLQVELDDLALSYLDPENYTKLRTAIDSDNPERERFIQAIAADVKQHIFEDADIEGEVYGRAKHLFSIYKKMKNQNKELDQIYDIFAIRIVVNSVKDCYAALGIVHEMYTPVPGRFKDYIAMPKPNGYKSLHTTVMSKDGRPFEIQIRTKDMHRIAEYGIAAHWKYKETKKDPNEKRGYRKESELVAEQANAEINKMTWLRELLELQKDNKDNSEFVNEVKNELNMYTGDVFCFSPQGKVVHLPSGSTTIDFAYRIHTAVGNRMVGAIVNGKVQPISYVIQNGDRIQIQTSMNSNGPSRDWLKLCKSSAARTKIRQWFKAQNKPENIEQGRILLEKYCKNKNVNLGEISTTEAKELVMRKYGFMDWESVLAAVGHGGLKEGQVVNKMIQLAQANMPGMTDEEAMEKVEADKTARLNKEKERRSSKGKKQPSMFVFRDKDGKIDNSLDGTVCVCAHCCHPLPGDEIVGFTTRNRGITVHRSDCKNFLSFTEAERARVISIEWAGDVQSEAKASFSVGIVVYAYNRTGLIADVSRVLSENGYDIDDFHTTKSRDDISSMTVRINVKSMDSLSFIIKKLEQIPSVFDVKRTNG